jgi:4-amino-4-deoxy-L-arabinose transferase-like glycosyltransferase
MERFSKAIIKKLNRESVILLLILIIGAFFRFYRLPDYLTFLGDEGRDVIIAKRIITELHPALIGPQTSVGNMYLGPLYYYLISLPLLFFGFSPVGPAALIASIGLITVGLVYMVGKKWFGYQSGLVASGLYAISPVVINYSRSSWNPNIMPFFALLAVWGIWKVWREKKYSFLIMVSVALAFILQSHYLGLLIFPAIGLPWLLSLKEAAKSKSLGTFIKPSLLGIVIFLLLMSPLLIFDLRHNFQNFNSMKKFFTVRQETVNLKPYKAIPQMWPIFKNFSDTLLGPTKTTNRDNSLWLAFIVIASAAFGLYKKESRLATGFVCTWIIFGIVGLGLYKQTIYDHYYGFLFPAPFLLVGLFLGHISRTKLLPVSAMAVAVLVAMSFNENPLKKSPNYQMARTQAIADFIPNVAENKPFNLALISKRNYDTGYKYFLDLNNAPVIKVEDAITDQLFVVCEDAVCNPINHPIAEIANFGWAKVDQVWNFPWNVRLFKLSHIEPLAKK